MKEQLTDLITERLHEAKNQLKEQFFSKHSFKVARHFVLDNLLPTELAQQIYAAFPNTKRMHLLSSYGELKLKYNFIHETNDLLKDLHYAIQHPRTVAAVEAITEIKNQVPDQTGKAGGISALLKGYYINPHLDNSHDLAKKLYRTVNVLYYVSPNWGLENGGNYELWDTRVKNRLVVPSLFNRLLIMETNRTSWHAVNPVLCKAPRCCVFNYYFSVDSPEYETYFHSASSIFFNPLFKARPEQKIRRALSSMRDKIIKRPYDN